MKVNFEHRQAAHCENGVTTNLLRHIGVNKITEPLAFGMGSGIFFIYIPFLKINNGPAFSYRTMPGMIFKRTCKSLGVEVVRKKFSSPEKARIYLDRCLASDQPVGCQVGVYYLTYFPKEYRFHFNAHNVMVYGKEHDQYLISDPVMENVTTLSSYELERVRFAKGAFAPRGQLYYPQLKKEVSDDVIRKAIVRGIKHNTRDMLHIPGPIAGIRGIRFTARAIMKWRDKLGVKTAGLYLAQLVRMQEEIGTGGGGFRWPAGDLGRAVAARIRSRRSRNELRRLIIVKGRQSAGGRRNVTIRNRSRRWNRIARSENRHCYPRVARSVSRCSGTGGLRIIINMSVLL